MDYIPQATYNDGNCAFHAIFGELIDSEYYCEAASKRRKYVAYTLKHARPGTALSQKIIDAIKALIMELQTSKITSGKITQIHGQAIADLYSRYIKAAQFDWKMLELTPDLINAYAAFIENPSQHLMEADLAIIAEVFGIRINYFIRGQAGQLINRPAFIPNPMRTNIREVAICHDGKNHYERMVLAVFENTNNLTTEKNNTKKITEKLHRLAYRLELELQKLEVEKNSNLKHHIVAAEQYMHAIRLTDSKLLSVLTDFKKSPENTKMEKNFSRNRWAHDFYFNHTEHLLTLLEQETLPAPHDIIAIKTISESQIENTKKSASAHLVQSFYNMAQIHTHLNNINKATHCYKRAIQYLPPTEQLNTRIILLAELGECFADLQKYKETSKCYEKIFNLLLSHSLWDSPDIDTKSLIANYIAAITLHGKSPKFFINKFETAFPQKNNRHIIFMLNTILFCLSKQSSLSNKCIEKINHAANTTQLALFDYFLRQLEDQPQIMLQEYPHDFNQYKNISEAMLRDLKKLQDILEINLDKVKTEIGDKAHHLEDGVEKTVSVATENIAMHFVNQGEKLQNNQNLNESQEFLEYALRLQKEYGHNTGKTLTLLGELYRNFYENSENIRAKDLCYQIAHVYFEEALNNPDPSIRATAHMGKAQLYAYKREGSNFEIHHFIESLANSSYIKNKSSKLIEHEATATYILNELVGMEPDEFEKIKSQLQKQIKMGGNENVEYKRKCLKLAKKFLGENPLTHIPARFFLFKKKNNLATEPKTCFTSNPPAFTNNFLQY